MLIAEEWPDLIYKYMSAPRAAQLIESLRLYMAPSSVLNDLYDLNIRGFWQEDEDSKYRILITNSETLDPSSSPSRAAIRSRH
jgi:hypothetical protein